MILGIKPLDAHSIKIKCERVRIEYQKNALTAVLRRFSGVLGIKPLDAHQMSKKRIPVAREDKKGQARYKSKTGARVTEKHPKNTPKNAG